MNSVLIILPWIVSAFVFFRHEQRRKTVFVVYSLISLVYLILVSGDLQLTHFNITDVTITTISSIHDDLRKIQSHPDITHKEQLFMFDLYKQFIYTLLKVSDDSIKKAYYLNEKQREIYNWAKTITADIDQINQI